MASDIPETYNASALVTAASTASRVSISVRAAEASPGQGNGVKPDTPIRMARNGGQTDALRRDELRGSIGKRIPSQASDIAYLPVRRQHRPYVVGGVERIAGYAEVPQVVRRSIELDQAFADGQEQAHATALSAITDAIGRDNMAARRGRVGARSTAGIGTIAETASNAPAGSVTLKAPCN
jgi:hypothetical protein